MNDHSLRLDPDVTVIRTFSRQDDSLLLPIHSLVITGTEPVLVDCGSAEHAASWWAQVEAVVDPVDVRWVFLTHDDADHTGNLSEVLERCIHATVVATWPIDRHPHRHLALPSDRFRTVGDGDTFVAGSRRLTTVRPPIFDSPTTLGLVDEESGTFWAADAFGLLVPYCVDEVADLDRDVWENGVRSFQQSVSPWVASVDSLRWRAILGRVAALDPLVIASAHGPIVRRRDIGRALDATAELPGLPANATVLAPATSP